MLWPRPRNHADASYMNARSDEDLYESIRGGGRAVGRSSLMPAFSDRFDALQVWSIVAFLRTLAPPLPAAVPAHRQVREVETILSRERAERAGGREGARVVAHALEDDEGGVTGWVMYPEASGDGVSVGLGLAFDAEARLLGAETHRRVRLDRMPPDSVDRWLEQGAVGELPAAPQLAASIRAAIRKATAELRESIGQRPEDLAAAVAAWEGPPADEGTRLYRQSCASCHGATGRVLGPGVVDGPFLPRNFADGARMNALSDEYLAGVIARGGMHWNLSGSMPAFPSLSDAEVRLLVEKVRSFAVPRPDRPCPCSSRIGACAMVDIAGHCRCRGAHTTEDSCPHVH